MARLTNEEYEKIKQKLLDVGLASFEHKGYNATGIQQLATQAGISKGSFYSYFSSKADFGVAVIRYYTNNNLEIWSSMLEKLIVEMDARHALSSTFIDLMNINNEYDKKKGCLLGTLAAEISEASDICRIELNNSVKRYKELLLIYIKLGQNQNVIRIDLLAERLVDLIWDSWQGSLLRMKIEKSIDPVLDDLNLLFQRMLLPI